MKKTGLVSLLVILTTLFSYAQDVSITTFILVRHAEKADDRTKNPNLSAEDYKRVEALTRLLERIDIDAVYSTDYKRTRNTVRQLASNREIEVQFYRPGDPAAIEKMIADHRGQTIVVSGHSNTIPGIANQLLGGKQFADFNESDYGNVLIVSITSGTTRAATVTHLRH